MIAWLVMRLLVVVAVWFAPADTLVTLAHDPTLHCELAKREGDCGLSIVTCERTAGISFYASRSSGAQTWTETSFYFDFCPPPPTEFSIGNYGSNADVFTVSGTLGDR